MSAVAASLEEIVRSSGDEASWDIAASGTPPSEQTITSTHWFCSHADERQPTDLGQSSDVVQHPPVAAALITQAESLQLAS
jgi:hypothetical protein